ncbi:MAG TPA: dihydrofolate reductase family protein [Thermoleophilaceae bacterium]|nr:dihydrofolate reductase family protein [Thermoleophilaceae bacterium]
MSLTPPRRLQDMGNVIVSQFITVDGVVEDPGGSENFERGGWAFEFSRGDDGDQFKLDEVMSAEALLLGRTTYEGFAAAWPSREGDFADKFNNMTKYVVSSTLTDPDWNNSHVIGVGDVERIKGEIDGDILVNGSVQLVGALLDAGLVDELRLMVFPVVLGKGKRLFSDGAKVPLALTETKAVGDDGVTVQVFSPTP